MGRPDRWYLRPFSQAIENEERDHAAGGREVEEEDVMDAVECSGQGIDWFQNAKDFRNG